ncbi:hypothetical protein NQZ68_028823 [Dissostichus eleginoides]|nr:hypothetical protein NQZ68_028823 [Dissostichus eleginoides]
MVVISARSYKEAFERHVTHVPDEMEFRKTDRSLLLSPDGSSRVPFDPKQKPKFGVLKSPPTALSARKTPKANRKSGHNTPKETAKRRPSAADFF